MGIENPIIIIGIPRSGTSMVSGIFANHGVFFGTCRKPSEYNPKGYFEHIEISRIIKKYKGDFVFSPNKIRNILLDDGYKDGLWAVKHGVQAIRVWKKFNPKIICCKRRFRANFKSYKKVMRRTKGEVTLPMFQNIYQKQIEIMRKTNGVFVYTDNIIKEDYSSLIKAFDYCGIEFNKEIANSFIEPKYWHYD